MNLLREYVRELLKEAAIGVDALVEKDVYITVSKDELTDYTVYYSDKNGEPKDGDRGVYGEVTINRASKGTTGPCDGAFVIVSTMATKGWGPMLYDVAMEVATQEGGGLTPDRRSVSNAAQNCLELLLQRQRRCSIIPAGLN